MRTYSEQLEKQSYSGQVMVERVCFFEEATATRFARFLNRHIGTGQASATGVCVEVGAVPAAAMKSAYILFGALPNYEQFR